MWQNETKRKRRKHKVEKESKMKANKNENEKVSKIQERPRNGRTKENEKGKRTTITYGWVGSFGLLHCDLSTQLFLSLPPT